jgi:hypothetical protein
MVTVGLEGMTLNVYDFDFRLLCLTIASKKLLALNLSPELKVTLLPPGAVKAGNVLVSRPRVISMGSFTVASDLKVTDIVC